MISHGLMFGFSGRLGFFLGGEPVDECVPQIILKTEDDRQVVSQLLCFVGHPVLFLLCIQEIWEDEREELLVTHSCTSLFLRESGAGSWQVLREIQWNCQPNKEHLAN